MLVFSSNTRRLPLYLALSMKDLAISLYDSLMDIVPCIYEKVFHICKTYWFSYQSVRCTTPVQNESSYLHLVNFTDIWKCCSDNSMKKKIFHTPWVIFFSKRFRPLYRNSFLHFEIIVNKENFAFFCPSYFSQGRQRKEFLGNQTDSS